MQAPALAQSRLVSLLVCATPLAGLSVAWAQSLPASLRACTAEADAGRRLACYDREMARLGEPTPRPEQTTPAAPIAPAAPVAPAAPPPQTAQSAKTSQAPLQATNPSATGNPAEPQPGMMAKARAALKKATSPDSDGKEPTRVSAHLTSVEGLPNELVLHLDNGQVWQQLEVTSGVLSLRPGDSVTIEKHLGSYWLSGPHVSSMKVRQKQ